MLQDLANLKSLLRLNQLPMSGRREITERLMKGESACELEEKILAEDWLGRADKLKGIRSRFDSHREVETAFQKGIRLLSVTDPDYPALLKSIFNPPWILYVRGSIAAEDSAAMAIVGTRHPSFYGIQQTQRFSRELSQSGLTIVSGLARGIDQAAHETALQIDYGRTIAVLGCGVDQCYPSENQKLYERIPEHGAVISEYPLGTPPRAHYFPERNRIIAGLSTGVLVVEAHYRSGALITAHEAIEEGREVFAVPGRVDQLTSRGTHRLIKEGAHLAENPQDILEILAFSLKGKKFVSSVTAMVTSQPQDAKVELPEQGNLAFSETSNELNADEEELMTLLEGQALSYDEMLDAWSSNELLPLLTGLEIRGLIVKQTDGSFAKRGRVH